MSKPKTVGCINATVKSTFKVGRRSFTYDGTTLGMVETAAANKVKIGSVLKTDMGINYTLTFTHRIWADRNWGTK